jgi:hypothetical protein
MAKYWKVSGRTMERVEVHHVDRQVRKSESPKVQKHSKCWEDLYMGERKIMQVRESTSPKVCEHENRLSMVVPRKGKRREKENGKRESIEGGKEEVIKEAKKRIRRGGKHKRGSTPTQSICQFQMPILLILINSFL